MKSIIISVFQLVASGIALVGLSESARPEEPPDRVVIDARNSDPVKALVDALQTPNRIVDEKPVPIVVELCVDLDLTGHSLVIGSDRSLSASPACARGPRTPLERVPRIYVRDIRPYGKPLFKIVGDNVLISGFRLEGPTIGIGGGDDRAEQAIRIDPAECVGDPCRPDPILNIEISNMEIFHWSGAGIEVKDNSAKEERGRLFKTNVGVVTIKNNFIHGNQHDAGNGYGVAVRYGAYALITQNVFDENRHAIAGGSSDKKKDFSGYTLRDNLILPKGGFHCLANWGWQNCWKTHQIDMHGNMSTIFGGELCCGIAGETIIIERNTILYTGEGGDFLPALLGPGFAIKIRGNPADKAVVDGNIFKHRSSLAAIRQNGGAVRKCAWPFGWPCWTSETGIDRPIIVLPNNVFGVDPMAELGSCDFFGDGQQDQFMATGVTWWAKSPVTQEWRYLNTMPERLSQLQLRKIDGDAVCDVAPRTMLPEALPEKYSKGGTGSWVPLLVVNPQ